MGAPQLGEALENLMDVLTRFLTKLYMTRFLSLLVCISLFILSLDLVTNAENISDRSDGGLAAVAKYGALRLPQIISENIKYSCLLGALMMLVTLMRHNQLAPLWDGGISQFGMIGRLTPVALLIGVCQFAIDDLVVPVAKSALQTWGITSSGSLREKSAYAATSANWIKVDNDIVRIPHGMSHNGTLNNFVVFERNNKRQLVAQMKVLKAKPQRDGWLLENVTRRKLAGGSESLSQLDGWGRGFKPKNMDELTVHPRDLAFHRLVAFVRVAAHGSWSPHLYQTWLHVKIAVCFVPLLMMCLVIALSQRFHRTGRTEVLFVVGLAVGFAFFISNGIGLALGEVGLLPPVIAGWAPTLGFTALTGAMAFSREVMTPSVRYNETDVS
jgi:lipopolysaccharide export system permease protein